MPVDPELTELIDGWLDAVKDFRAAEVDRRAAYEAEAESLSHLQKVGVQLYERLKGRGAVVHRGRVVLARENSGVEQHRLLD